jgi:Domain of unknown function (DUF1906)
VNPLAIDYSFQRPDPAAIRAAGYLGVLRYGGDNYPSKDLSASEIASLHEAGLAIYGIVFETTATRATAGAAAGAADARSTIEFAQDLGYPAGGYLFAAVDEDVPWSSVSAYFEGWCSVTSPYVMRPYGSAEIIDGFAAAGFGVGGWQTAAWSSGVVSPNAAVYQRVTPTLPPIPGGGYDEDVVLINIPGWGPTPVPPSPEEDPVILVLQPTGGGNAQPTAIPATVGQTLTALFDAIDASPAIVPIRVVIHKAGSDPSTWGPVETVYGPLSEIDLVQGVPFATQLPAGYDAFSIRNDGAVGGPTVSVSLA